MSFTRVKPANWAVNEKLTSTQMNTLDTQQANSVDKTSAGDTVSGPLVFSGAGRFAQSVTTGADANTTYQPNAQRVVRVTSAVTAARTYTIGTTGVVAGDIFEIFADATCTQVISVDGGSGVIWKIGYSGNLSSMITPYACFIYVGSAWRVFRMDRAPGIRYESFLSTTPTTWTCPPGVFCVQVTQWGGGGGGAGGMDGALNNTTYPKGGGGGGASMPHSSVYAVTPGVAYAVAAGAGGAAGTANNSGADGGASYFGTYYARGGGGGGVNTETGATAISSGGSPGSAGGAISTTLARAQKGIGQGGYSASNTATSAIKDGAIGWQFLGASGGANGTDNGGGGGHKGGGGGGGGASGPAGPGGVGGAGGNGDVTLGTNGVNGTAASANTGAGGGGGGGGGDSATTAGTAGTGGAGGSGAVYVIF